MSRKRTTADTRLDAAINDVRRWACTLDRQGAQLPDGRPAGADLRERAATALRAALAFPVSVSGLDSGRLTAPTRAGTRGRAREGRR